MKKGMLLQSELSYIIAKLGHTDQITIADAGLPIPEHVQRIDLALTAHTPPFLETLTVVLSEMQVEHVIIATEIVDNNPAVYEALSALCVTYHITVEWVSHEQFKRLTHQSKAIVRTGECSPYANIILQSGVTFK